MRKTLYSFILVLAAVLASCEEWEPVVGNYDDPGKAEEVTLVPNTTIAELKALYKRTGSPVEIGEDLIIGGQVISDDRSGNVYRSLYIQDETGAIELKLGKTGLYNDYKLGQWVYVKCGGLTVGTYGGMLQLGLTDPTGDYETTYLDVDYLISAHVFRGAMGTPVAPVEVSESDLRSALNAIPQSPFFGKYVTIRGVRYANEIFVLLYINPSMDTKASSNRVFLSDGPCGVTTWAMTRAKYKEYLNSGVWDSFKVGNSRDQVYGTVADHKAEMLANAAAYSVSQYFNKGGVSVQVRTSGYSKFADAEIAPEILSGAAAVDLTGILTNYNGAIQFTLLGLDGVSIAN